MAKLVLINNYSYREGINEIGDIVEIVDEDVELNGPGYYDEKGNPKFTILLVKGVTRQEIQLKQKENWPDRKFIEEDRYWLSSEDSFWYIIREISKYRFSMKNVPQQDISKLQQANVSASDKLTIIGSIPATFVTIEENMTTTEHMLLMYSEYG